MLLLLLGAAATNSINFDWIALVRFTTFFYFCRLFLSCRFKGWDLYSLKDSRLLQWSLSQLLFYLFLSCHLITGSVLSLFICFLF